MNNKDHKGFILIKYGGNAMLDEQLTTKIIGKVAELERSGYQVIIVHGGGPFIEDNLKLAGIESEFIEGHRRTSEEAMKYIEMALKGHVNSKLVKLLNKHGMKGVGLSGKDGGMVKVNKRYHITEEGKEIDLGFVGDVDHIDTSLLRLLLDHDFIPVVSTIASGEDGNDYNVNADMFAGHLAGALQVSHFIVLTDVDGLMEDPNKPDTLIKKINIQDIDSLKETVIKGGMIPKTEACKIAVGNGAGSALIINGTKPAMIKDCLDNPSETKFTQIIK